jgi:peroxiredoxin
LRLFGLSRQTTEYQRELVERLALPFPILSDAGGHFAGALRLPSFATGGTMYLRRMTLLIEEGRIEQVFYPIGDPAGHAGDLLLKLQTKD